MRQSPFLWGLRQGGEAGKEHGGRQTYETRHSMSGRIGLPVRNI